MRGGAWSQLRRLAKLLGVSEDEIQVGSRAVALRGLACVKGGVRPRKCACWYGGARAYVGALGGWRRDEGRRCFKG